MRGFKLFTKFNGDWEFLTTLRQYGREAADRWIREHFDNGRWVLLSGQVESSDFDHVAPRLRRTRRSRG